MSNTTETNQEAAAPVVPIVPDKLKDIKAKLTEAEKENFFKMFVSDQPYEDVETIFNGKIQLKFTTLSIAQNNAVLEQQKYDIEKGIARNDDQYLIRVIQYRLAGGLLSINGVPFGPDITPEKYPANKETGTTYIAKKADLMASWPTPKMSSITEAFNRFERKIMALTEESFKESF